MTSLWTLAHNGASLPAIQHLDIHTLDSIEENSIHHLLAICSNTDKPSEALHLSDHELATVQNCCLARSDYLNQHIYPSMHGIRHALRVMLFSAIIAKAHKMEILPVVLAASFHDCRRNSDKRDMGHGKRAADYFNSHAFSSLLSEDQKDGLYKVIEFHESEDYIAENSFIQRHLNILKLADCFDRYRMPKQEWWPDVQYMSSPDFVYMLPQFRNVTLSSERDFLELQDDSKIAMMIVDQFREKK